MPPHLDADPQTALAKTRALEGLRDRLLLAVAGTLAAACSDATRPSPLPPQDGARTDAVSQEVSSEPSPPATSAPAPATPEPSSASVDPHSAQSHAATDPPVTPDLAPGCFVPRSGMRSTGTGGPAAAPPPSAFDKNGCLPSSMVSNGCCNGATGGPRFQGGACCYSFPKNAPCCGRPFLVGGEPHVAAVIRGRAWLDAAGPGASHIAHRLDAQALEDLAAGWLRDARLEHASIASFARFVMDLLALGAPADLVHAAGVAMLDEVEHARACFALGSRFLGEELAAGPLPVAAAAATRSFDEIVRSAVIEGCVGEAIAAHLASERLSAATDPEVQRALSRIAEDEARHAALAYRFVAWVLREGGEPARERVEGTFEEALSGYGAHTCSDLSRERRPWRAPFGLLDDEAERAATRAAIERVVRPAARALAVRRSTQAVS
jgi:hypothetical protein